MTKAKRTTQSNTLKIEAPKDDEIEKAKAIAAAVLRPAVTGAVTITAFTKSYGDVDLTALVNKLTEHSKSINDGDLKRAEAMLITQAQTLDAIFNNLAQRAALNLGEYINAADRYMRLALKAQSQCRATLQTLGELKNPQPVAFVKQANISNGPQQVNNGDTFAPNTRAHAEKNQNQPNELLEEKPNEQLDTRTPSASGRTDSAIATVGEIDRADNGSR